MASLRSCSKDYEALQRQRERSARRTNALCASVAVGQRVVVISTAGWCGPGRCSDRCSGPPCSAKKRQPTTLPPERWTVIRPRRIPIVRCTKSCSTSGQLAARTVRVGPVSTGVAGAAVPGDSETDDAGTGPDVAGELAPGVHPATASSAAVATTAQVVTAR